MYSDIGAIVYLLLAAPEVTDPSWVLPAIDHGIHSSAGQLLTYQRCRTALNLPHAPVQLSPFPTSPTTTKTTLIFFFTALSKV